jgi:hypothetical protein
MVELLDVAALLLGLLLRYGVPIGITALVVWMLTKLDARWQEQADLRRVARSTLGAEVRQVRCWETTECSRDQRENCPAYTEPEVPCWQVFRKRDSRLREECLTCHVFLEAPVPTTT